MRPIRRVYAWICGKHAAFYLGGSWVDRMREKYEGDAVTTCDNCEEDFDPIAHRWRCPHCGWKAACCEGEPQ